MKGRASEEGVKIKDLEKIWTPVYTGATGTHREARTPRELPFTLAHLEPLHKPFREPGWSVPTSQMPTVRH